MRHNHRTLWLILPLVLLGGCTQVRNLWREKLGQANLQFQVTPGDLSGSYKVVGKADLPDQTEIRVAAVRYLYPTTLASNSLTPKPTYSILAYQTTEVKEGQWQAQLNLWQVAPNGQFQEDWQLHEKLKLSLKPASDVVFLATLAPGDKADQLQQVEVSLQKSKKVIDTALIRQTVVGDRYLQSNQVLTVALPTGSTTPPPIQDKDINGGWGRRYLIPPEAPNPNNLAFPENRRTNAHPAPTEFIR
ncbi:hypothetical protein [Phormidesmis sp. 146-33]